MNRTKSEKLIEKLSSINSADWQQECEKKQKAIEARRKALHEKDLELTKKLVAWLDVMGFGQQVLAVQTEEQLRQVYRKILLVHDRFNKCSASADPDEQEKIDAVYGRKVIALSDGLVVSSDLEPYRAHGMDPFDLAGHAICDLILGQIECVLHGVFLRGGISFGWFHFENDILLSPALVEAYQQETKFTQYPVIAIDEETLESICGFQGGEHESPNGNSIRRNFRKIEGQTTSEGKAVYFLDYLAALADPGAHGPESSADWELIRDKSRSDEERERIWWQSAERAALARFQIHKEKVLAACASALDEKVKKRYQWLMKYHNATISRAGTYLDQARIDVPCTKDDPSPNA